MKEFYFYSEKNINHILNEMFIVQARPETVNSNKTSNEIIEYKIKEDVEKNVLVTGISVGDKIGSGNVKILN